MTDFKAKMHQIRFRLGPCRRPRWGSLVLTALPTPPSWISGAASRQGEGMGWGRRETGREGEVEGREREGPKLLLNQGPSEPCYATVPAHVYYVWLTVLTEIHLLRANFVITLHANCGAVYCNRSCLSVWVGLLPW